MSSSEITPTAPVKFNIPQSKPDIGRLVTTPLLRPSPLTTVSTAAKAETSQQGTGMTIVVAPTVFKATPASSVHVATTNIPAEEVKSSASQKHSPPPSDKQPMPLPTALNLPSFKRNAPSRKIPSPPAGLPTQETTLLSHAALPAASRYRAEAQKAQENRADRLKKGEAPAPASVKRGPKKATTTATADMKKQGIRRSRVDEEDPDDEDIVVRKRQRKPAPANSERGDSKQLVAAPRKIVAAPIVPKKEPITSTKVKLNKKPVLVKQKLVELSREQIEEQAAARKKKPLYICPLMVSLEKMSGYTFKR